MILDIKNSKRKYIYERSENLLRDMHRKNMLKIGFPKYKSDFKQIRRNKK